MAEVSSSTGMDTEFLKRTVGEALSEALASLVVAQPADPIEFIGEALLDYIKRREIETQRNNHAEAVEQLLTISRQKEQVLAEAKAAKEAAAHAKTIAEQEVAEAIEKAPSHAEIYSKVLDFVKDRLGATGVQLGRKVVVGGQEIIEIIAASTGREHMIGKELKGLREGEDPEEDTAEEDITFDLWKKTEMPPPPDHVYDEDGELIPNEELDLIPPEHVLVENVMRNPRVTFFGIPKLGSYLALPITYGSWLHPGGISEVPPPQDGEDKEKDQDEVDLEAGEEVVEEVTKETGLYRKNVVPAYLVLCMDTIGQGRCFSEKDIAWAKKWAAKLKARVEALEGGMFEAEEALLPSFNGSEATELVSRVTDGEKAKIEEALAGLNLETLEENKERIAKAAQYCIKVEAMKAVGDLVGLMGKLSLAPSAGVLAVLERALLLVGKARANLCDARGDLDWSAKMRAAVSTELLPRILAFNPEDPSNIPLAADAKEAVESIDAESVRAVNVPAFAILEWMSSAVTAVEIAEAEADRTAAAAEAETAAAAAEAEALAEEQAEADEEDDED